MLTTVEISSARGFNSFTMMMVQMGITGSTALCCTPPALT
jgi:hypothetical protein